MTRRKMADAVEKALSGIVQCYWCEIDLEPHEQRRILNSRLPPGYACIGRNLAINANGISLSLKACEAREREVTGGTYKDKGW